VYFVSLTFPQHIKGLQLSKTKLKNIALMTVHISKITNHFSIDRHIHMFSLKYLRTIA